MLTICSLAVKLKMSIASMWVYFFITLTLSTVKSLVICYKLLLLMFIYGAEIFDMFMSSSAELNIKHGTF